MKLLNYKIIKIGNCDEYVSYSHETETDDPCSLCKLKHICSNDINIGDECKKVLEFNEFVEEFVDIHDLLKKL